MSSNERRPPPTNPNFKNLHDVTATAYVTNFPTLLGSKDLWKLYDKCGTVADVYIARKLSKIGQRFAFVRFLKVKNKELLIDDLNKIWIGSYHLFAAMARFEKKPNTYTKTNPKPASNHPNNHAKTTLSSTHVNPNKSYVNALNGNSSSNHATQPKTILKSVTLDESDLIDTSDMRNVIIAKVRDVHLILNINNVLNKEGFCNFQCKYIGGMWLWIEFDSPEACLKLQTNKEMSWYFSTLKHINKSFVADERVIWIETGGLPLNAWTSKAFKKIALSWGEPLFVDEDPSKNTAIGRVCIKTRIHGQVNEICKVVILGKSFNVSVKEFAGWVPDFKTMESLSSYHSEMDNSNKHDNHNSDNGSQDEEEGEIPNTNIIQEDEFVRDTLWSDEEADVEKKQDGSTNEQQNPPTDMPEYWCQQSSFMNSLSFNTCGLGTCKCKAIAKLCNKHKVSILGIQETHSLKIDPLKVKCSWGNFQFDYAECPSTGRSGGLVSIWDPNVFQRLTFFLSSIFSLLKKELVLLSIPLQLISSIISFEMLIFRTFRLEDQHVPVVHCANPIVSFKNKMEDLKPVIKVWSSNRNNTQSWEKEDLIKKIKEFDDNIATRSDHATDAPHRSFWIDKLRIKSEGQWIEDPIGIKDAFLNYYEKKFKKIEVAKVISRSPFYKSLNEEQNNYLVFSCSESKIKEAICDYGSDKSPGPDGFTFAFYKKFWDMIKGYAVYGFQRKLDQVDFGLLEFSHFFDSDQWNPYSGIQHSSWSSARGSFIPISLHYCYGGSPCYGGRCHGSRPLEKFQRVGVPFEDVELLATLTGCNAMASPFCYLGLPIDYNMALVKNWDLIIDKFSKSLSKWKASLLSIGGRSTLIIRFWALLIAWNLALASKEKKGLGIGSLYSLNHALIQKWRWGFLNIAQALWARLIVSIRGTNEDASSFFSHVQNQRVWGRIIGSINNMHEKGFIPYSSIKWRVNNGASSKFWHDTWIGNTSLQNQFPRLYRLGPNRDIMLASFHNPLSEISLNDSVDIWASYIETPEFTVKSARKHIDNNFLSDGGLATSRKGIDVASITSPICDCGIETSHHTLWTCSLATTVWHRVLNWLDLSPPIISNIQDLFAWLDDLHISSKRKILWKSFAV
uniref:RNA-directed DNA polymerase, eukaryota n=1 Tax=Tanacetum cinerariifolium TaxID=118510 RepID=A0A699GPZ9_TANCI|nr:RNA-directed DNA polymerase, eukaryota [Tanacetum cinerariifolium]